MFPMKYGLGMSNRNPDENPVNPYHTDGKFSCRVNRSLRINYLELIILIKMMSQKSVVLESSVKPSLGCMNISPGLV